jgi:zinc finger HIT domain-containing protein 1
VAERRGPKPLSALLDEARLELLPAGVPSYLRAEMGPPRTATPRKLCSVCGFQAPCVPPAALRICACWLRHLQGSQLALRFALRSLPAAARDRYTCPRCGMRFCSRKCSGTHADTRCLRFTVY